MVDTLVDAIVEFFSITIQSNFHDTEWTFFLLLCTERGVGASRLVANFQCMNHATMVLAVYDVVATAEPTQP